MFGRMIIGSGMAALIEKFLAKRADKLNAAQRLIQSWYVERKPYEPKRPHLVCVVVPTNIQHADKQGNLKFHRAKIYPKGKTDGPYVLKTVPMMLKYEHTADQSRKYPYGSRRQGYVAAA